MVLDISWLRLYLKFVYMFSFSCSFRNIFQVPKSSLLLSLVDLGSPLTVFEFLYICQINISLISSESAQLTLNAGKRDCVLHTGTLVPEEKMFPQLPSYNKIFTPLNGAYFLVLAVIIYGGIWTCCKLRNKKRHDGVAYQELEMAMPDSVQATGVDTSEGWDQGWDDDWNDDLAVMSPGRQHAGSISANGLTSRSSIRDGWENNWED